MKVKKIFIVYQGKDSNANDYVTLELSDENDIWFHAKGVPGSHILIKVKDKLPQHDVIKKVAELAAKNSKAPEGDVTIVYCKKKFVKKEPGMNPGQVKVDYTNAYEIKVPKK
jgi:predicted ribosome quality control (RQC) complex YloA/Tae2 family protein